MYLYNILLGNELVFFFFHFMFFRIYILVLVKKKFTLWILDHDFTGVVSLKTRFAVHISKIEHIFWLLAPSCHFVLTIFGIHYQLLFFFYIKISDFCTME